MDGEGDVLRNQQELAAAAQIGFAPKQVEEPKEEPAEEPKAE